MTCLEKYMEDYKDYTNRWTIDDLYRGESCPHFYKYLEVPAYCGDYECCCKDCWNREVEEKKLDDVINEACSLNPAISPEELKEATYEIKFPTNGKEALEIQEKLYKDMVIIGDSVGDDVTKILDSGNRREFETGAVRDIQEGKGRCDLMPLDVVGKIYNDAVFDFISQYQDSGDYSKLTQVLLTCAIFKDHEDNDPCWMNNLLLEVSKHFEEGAKKYGENNWQKGIPTHCYIDSAVRHYLKYLRGDKDEPHDRAFVWNILCCIWTCIHKPELNDYAKKVEE